MTKIEDLSTEEQALAKIFKTSLDYINKSDKLYFKQLSIKENFIKKMLDLKYEEEPPKFLKKAHKKWEDEIDDLNNQLYDIYKKVEETVQEQHDFYEKFKEA